MTTMPRTGRPRLDKNQDGPSVPLVELKVRVPADVVEMLRAPRTQRLVARILRRSRPETQVKPEFYVEPIASIAEVTRMALDLGLRVLLDVDDMNVGGDDA